MIRIENTTNFNFPIVSCHNVHIVIILSFMRSGLTIDVCIDTLPTEAFKPTHIVVVNGQDEI